LPLIKRCNAEFIHSFKKVKLHRAATIGINFKITEKNSENCQLLTTF